MNGNNSNDSSDKEDDNENGNEKNYNEGRSDSEHDFSPSKHDKKIKSKGVIDDTEYNSCSSDDKSIVKSKKRSWKAESDIVKINKSKH